MKIIQATFFFISFSAFAQIPTWVQDSLIFETRKGRSCEKVRLAQLSEIHLLDSALLIHVKQAELYESVIANQNAIIESFPKEIKILQAEHQKQIGHFKAKLRRVWKVVFLEGGIIVILVFLL